MKTFIKVWLGIGLFTLILGIGFLVYAAVSGEWSDIPTYSIDESYDDVKSLNIQISYGEVYIEEGADFHIEADNLYSENFDSYVVDGTWVIKENPDNNFSLFGLKFPMGQFEWWNNDLTQKIIITVPEGFIAEEISLDIAAGFVEAEVIRAVEGDFSIEAGEMRINQLQVFGESQYRVGAGQMILNQIEANNITLDCGLGNIEMDGSITGDNFVTCGVGKVRMNLSGNEEDYSYEVESGIGSVNINGEKYHNISSQKISNEGADNNFTLECGIGDISVDFN